MNFRAITSVALAGMIGIAADVPPVSAYVTAAVGQATGTEYNLTCPAGEHITTLVIGRSGYFTGLEVQCQTGVASAGKLTGIPLSTVYNPGTSTGIFGYTDYRPVMGWWISALGLRSANGDVASVRAEEVGEPSWYYSLRCAGSDKLSGINVFFKYPASKSPPTMRRVAARCAE